MSSEVRVTDPLTGGQKGSKDQRYDLIPHEALEGLATVYGVGCRKYSARNWERGYAWGLSFAAMMRHAWAFWRGEEIDKETGLDHILQVAWHAFTLHTFSKRGLGTDDRIVLGKRGEGKEEDEKDVPRTTDGFVPPHICCPPGGCGRSFD